MKIIILLFSIFLGFVQSSAAKECNPQPKSTFKFFKGKYLLTSKPANFDPCHSSIRFKIPKSKELPPLVIGIGGGGGREDAERLMGFLYKKGFATLEFDAYKMNGISNYKENSIKYGNDTRQEMIFPLAKQIVEWALKQNKIDRNRIYVYGVSNGATVAANIGAVFDTSKIKAVISDAPTHSGMGMPDNIKTPMILTFGKLDNYGATKEDGWRWSWHGSCRMSVSIPEAPPGNTKSCNRIVSGFKDSNSENHMIWLKKQKAKGKNVDVWFYENAAHGIYVTDLKFQKRKHKVLDITFYSNVGGKPSAQKKFANDILGYLNSIKN